MIIVVVQQHRTMTSLDGGRCFFFFTSYSLLHIQTLSFRVTATAAEGERFERTLYARYTVHHIIIIIVYT
jgi:hypothetical protein